MQGPTTGSSLASEVRGDHCFSQFLLQGLSSAGIKRVHSCVQRTRELGSWLRNPIRIAKDWLTRLGEPAIRLPRSDRISLSQRGSPGAVRPPTVKRAHRLERRLWARAPRSPRRTPASTGARNVVCSPRPHSSIARSSRAMPPSQRLEQPRETREAFRGGGAVTSLRATGSGCPRHCLRGNVRGAKPQLRGLRTGLFDLGCQWQGRGMCGWFCPRSRSCAGREHPILETLECGSSGPTRPYASMRLGHWKNLLQQCKKASDKEILGLTVPKTWNQ